MKSKNFQNEILIFMVYIRTHPEELLFAEDLYQYDFLSSNIRLNELLSRCMKNLHTFEFFEVYIMIFLKGWVLTESYTRSSCRWVLTQFCKTYHINFTDSYFENFYIIILIFENWFIKFTYWIRFLVNICWPNVDQNFKDGFFDEFWVCFDFISYFYH